MVLVLVHAAQPGSCSHTNLLSYESIENHDLTKDYYVQNATKADKNPAGQALEGDYPRSRLSANDNMSLDAPDEPELLGGKAMHICLSAVPHAEMVENPTENAYELPEMSSSTCDYLQSRLSANDNILRRKL